MKPGSKVKIKDKLYNIVKSYAIKNCFRCPKRNEVCIIRTIGPDPFVCSGISTSIEGYTEGFDITIWDEIQESDNLSDHTIESLLEDIVEEKELELELV
jgi:hypothetical protein